MAKYNPQKQVTDGASRPANAPSDSRQRSGFTFYRSYFEAVFEILPDEEQAPFLKALTLYALDGIEPNPDTLGPFGSKVWRVIFPNLLSDRRRYHNGCKGGCPKGTVNNPNGNNQFQKLNEKVDDRVDNREDDQEDDQEDNQRITERISNVNDNVNVNVNVNVDVNDNVDVNVDENVNNNKRERDLERKSSKRFSPPSLIDVRNYLEEIDYRTITAEQFVDYYESVGWKVGGKPMQDWRAAIRQWQRRDQSAQQSPAGAHPNQYTNPTKSNNYENHHTQLDTPRTTAGGSQSNGGRPNGPNNPNSPNSPNNPNTASALESRRIRPNGSHSLEPLESRRVRPASTLEPSFDYSDLKGGNRLPDLKFTPTDDCIGGYSSVHFSGKYEKGFV